MAKLDRDLCTGCRISLPTNMVNKARSGNALVQCPNCERILYRVAMRAVGYFRETPRARYRSREQNKAFLDTADRKGYEPASTFVDVFRQQTGTSGLQAAVAYLRGARDRHLVIVVPDIAALGPGHRDALRRCFQIEASARGSSRCVGIGERRRMSSSRSGVRKSRV